MPRLERPEEHVFVLWLGDDENRLNPAFVEAVDRALDEVEATPGASLVTAGEGKQYSGGLDLDWLGDPANADAAAPFMAAVHALLARLLVSPAYCVAAVNGHAFAAGAMLTAAHDYRIMRADRGYWCLPEIDLGLPFTPGMSALLDAKLPAAARHEAMVTGRRYDGPAATGAGIVDETSSLESLVDRCVEVAAAQAGRDGGTRQVIKRGLYGAAEATLLRPQ